MGDLGSGDDEALADSVEIRTMTRDGLVALRHIVDKANESLVAAAPPTATFERDVQEVAAAKISK